MDLGILFKRAGKAAAENSPAILTAIGVTGTIATAYLAAKGAFKSAEDIRKEQERIDQEEKSHPLTLKEQAELTWKNYVPAAASAAMTVAAIICSARIQDRRTAALASAYSVVEKSYAEYRAKNIEQNGKKKDQAVRDDIAQDLVNSSPPGRSEVVVLSGGTVLCLDGHSKRYFMSDMETLRRAENDMNYLILNEDNASISDFWDMIGLSHTDGSDELGWNTDRKFELNYSTAMTDDGRPCIAYSFNNSPIPLFYRASH